jgi:hypothetical protein
VWSFGGFGHCNKQTKQSSLIYINVPFLYELKKTQWHLVGKLNTLKSLFTIYDPFYPFSKWPISSSTYKTNASVSQLSSITILKYPEGTQMIFGWNANDLSTVENITWQSWIKPQTLAKRPWTTTNTSKKTMNNHLDYLVWGNVATPNYIHGDKTYHILNPPDLNGIISD